MTVQQKLRGTGVALVTPFAKDGSIDFTALGKVIDHVIDGGVEYLITLGTTGETPTLSKEEKMAIIAFTFSHTADRVPIIVGVGGNNTAEVINDLQNFPLDKALAILSVVPFLSHELHISIRFSANSACIGVGLAAVIQAFAIFLRLIPILTIIYYIFFEFLHTLHKSLIHLT